MDSEDSKTLGQVAFEAYSAAKSGSTFDGRPIPPWADLGEEVSSAWEAAAGAVAGRVLNAVLPALPSVRKGSE